MSYEVERYKAGQLSHRNGNSGGEHNRFTQATRLQGQMQRYARAVRKRWWILVLALALIGGPALLYAWLKAPTYQSSSILWLSGKVTMPGTPTFEQELNSYIATQAQLIKSPVIQSRAFAKVVAKFPSLTATAKSAAESPFSLSVRSSLKSAVLELRGTGPTPETTQAFVNAVVDEYLAFKQESRSRTSSGALSSLTQQVQDVEKQIQQQQNDLSVFQSSNNVSFLTEHGVSAGTHLARISETLSDLKTEYRLLQSLTPTEYKGLAEGPAVTASETVVPGERAARATAPNASASQTAYYQALQQMQALKARRDEFASVLRPTHSKMIKLNQEIAGLEKLMRIIQQEGDEQALLQMNNRKKALELQIQNLETQYGAWETNAAQASAKLTQFEKLKQDLQRSQALYDRLMGLLQTVDVGKNLDQEPLSPLAPAAPGKPTMTKYGIAAAGIFLAALVGFGVFLLLEYLDDRFTSARELSLTLPAELVAQIPQTGGSRNGRAQLSLPDPAFVESFRNLRSSLMFMSGDESQPRVILVTSSIPKEGKTTVASNLARTLARSGANVLLVDADVRRSMLHRVFETRLDPGLLEVLGGEVAAAEAIIPTSEPNLSLMPAGRRGNMSSDVFLSRDLVQLLKQLRQQYAYIVIDTAPVLATDDATSLGPQADGVFMVVRAGYTSARLAREALDRLRMRNIPVLGTIYNGAGGSDDYYSHYGHEYYVTDNSPKHRASSAGVEASNPPGRK